MSLVLQSVPQSLYALFQPKYQHISPYNTQTYSLIIFTVTFIPFPLYTGTINALLQSLGTIPSINALLHNFQIQSITISPPLLILSLIHISEPTRLLSI